MDFPTAYSMIKDRITEQWAISHPDVPLVFTNEQRPTFESAPKCVHVDIQGGATRTVGWGGAVGGNRQRQSGDVIFRVFVPSDTGMVDAYTLSEDCCKTLRYWQAGSGLRFFDAGPAGGGEDDKSGVFYELDAIASFFFDLIG